jgi:hypothetical protein
MVLPVTVGLLAAMFCAATAMVMAKWEAIEAAMAAQSL